MASGRLEHTRTIWAWALLLPTLTVLALVAAWPLGTTFYLSFTDASLLTLGETLQWVGFENYRNALNDPHWWEAVRTTLIFTVFSVSIETALGIGIALVLNANFKGRGLLRAAVLVPWAVPTVISAKMWSWMYHDLYGVVNSLLTFSAIIDYPVAWLADDSLALGAMIAVDIWKTTPFMALLLLAGLQSISKDVYEAASLDTHSEFKIFFRITLPLIKPALIVAIIFRSLDALRIFDLVYVLTGNKASTATMAVYARQRLMEFQEFGYGSAVSMLIFLMIGLLTILYLRFCRFTEDSK